MSTPSLEQAAGRLQALFAQRVGSNANVKMDEMGQRLVLDYVQELTRSILESAFTLTRYHDSKRIEMADISLILGTSNPPWSPHSLTLLIVSREEIRCSCSKSIGEALLL